MFALKTPRQKNIYVKILSDYYTMSNEILIQCQAKVGLSSPSFTIVI